VLQMSRKTGVLSVSAASSMMDRMQGSSSNLQPLSTVLILGY
jgi:hypothetical protein